MQPKQILCRAGVKKVKRPNTTKRRRNIEKSGLYAEQSITVKHRLFPREPWAIKMSHGYQPREPNAPRYCEVVQIGIEEDTAEVTLFYTTERGLNSAFCTIV